jgi:hypothetical protein
MALQKEIWISDIESNLYADNQFMSIIGKSDDAYVDNKTVHLPQSGTKPSVVKDRGVVPASISQRSDTELTYSLSSYSTDPILIKDYDDVAFLSYDKRMDVLGDHLKTLGDTIADWTLWNWAATTSGAIVRTTGATSAGSLTAGATGTRKLVTLEDLRNGIKKLKTQNLGAGRIFMIVPEAMYWNDLLAITEITKNLDFGGRAVLPDGSLPSVLGMSIVTRTDVVVYDNAGTPARKALGDNGDVLTTAATDNNSILLVHENYVRKAKGAIKVFDSMDRPEYYGSIFSAEVLHGASKSRTGGEGVVSIIQAS